MHVDAPIQSDKLQTCSVGSRRKLFGLITRKERWGLSWRGWLMLLLLVSLVGGIMVLAIHPFLAVTDRVETNILVVEGWVHEYAIRIAVAEFKQHSYGRVFSTGGPVAGMGGYSNVYNTSASVGAGRLRAAGLASELVQMVPCRVNDRDRTYHSALALREWFREHNMPVHGINVVTEDAHARRSRLLFQKAFGKDVRVGIISVPNPDYDATHWWRYSEGVREMIGEGTAYFYARLFFRP